MSFTSVQESSASCVKLPRLWNAGGAGRSNETRDQELKFVQTICADAITAG